jgi:hypothetical protein
VGARDITFVYKTMLLKREIDRDFSDGSMSVKPIAFTIRPISSAASMTWCLVGAGIGLNYGACVKERRGAAINTIIKT